MLIVFIDAYPFERIDELLENIETPLYARKLKPGFGYSVNLHNELFSGIGPDEIGYFGEWNFAAFPNHGALSKVVFKVIENFPKLFRIWRLFLNKIVRIRKFYIPSRFVKSFERMGVYPFTMRKRINNILEKNDFDFCVADAVRAPLNRKDEVALEQAIASIRSGKKNVLVSLCDLDGLFHEYGTQASQVLAKINWLSKTIQKLINEYRVSHPAGDIVVLSDHGIRDVDTRISLNLSDYNNQVGSGKLVYFYDSLYLSVWGKDYDCIRRFTKHVTNKYKLVRLTDKDRAEGRLLNPKFGHEIFVCPEGACFSPNFFGFRTLKAYHGYYPSHLSSHGILLTSFEVNNVIKNVDVYTMLDTRLTDS